MSGRVRYNDWTANAVVLSPQPGLGGAAAPTGREWFVASALEEALKVTACEVIDPNNQAPLGSAIQGLVERDGQVAVEVVLGYPCQQTRGALEGAIVSALKGIDGVKAVSVDIRHDIVPHAVQDGLAPLDGVGNIIAVASGKGGVGKSTVAVSLALALQQQGARVGVLDADIYGPSIPRMLGLHGRPQTAGEQRIVPMEALGLQAMSIGVLVDVDQAMIWRGPIATQALQQMLTQTQWHSLDYLILDLPPGTGDIQLTLAQKVPVAGVVTVTTPQAVAVDDVRRAVAMFNKVKVPVLGVVENMSTHICSQCGHEDAIFGAGGGERIAEEMGIALLGQGPLDATLGRAIDGGEALAVSQPDHPVSTRFGEIACRVGAQLATQSQNRTVRMPKIKIVE